MGLDMYAYTTREELPEAVDFKVNNATETHYWRKPPTCKRPVTLYPAVEVLPREARRGRS